MLSDGVRIAAYAEALRKTVTSDSVVLDIGTGIGIFALLACKFGARRVYAVEQQDVIGLARKFAAANGFDGRIEFVQGLSTEITLPEPVSIVVSDLRGVLPLFEHHLPSIIDARQRLLAPGGILIPRRDTLWVSMVAAPELYRRNVAIWSIDTYGLNLELGRQAAANIPWKERGTTREQLLEPQPWVTLQYATIESTDVSGEATWEAKQAGTAHGITVWFESTLADGVGFSNAPGHPPLVYGQLFFPLSHPVDISSGDLVSVILRADLVGKGYIWRWETRITSADSPGSPKTHLKQSNFYGQLRSPRSFNSGL